MGHSSLDPAFQQLRPWNEGCVLGAKLALKAQQVWAIRFWRDQHRRLRDRALFDFAIDSTLRGCDVVKVRIGDLVAGGRVRNRAIVVQQKTKRPVHSERVEPARKTLLAWLERDILKKAAAYFARDSIGGSSSSRSTEGSGRCRGSEKRSVVREAAFKPG
ncbi:integrase [Sphingomonas sp. HMP9]|nr:integrase [Sphingomonas sp. HMP9]